MTIEISRGLSEIDNASPHNLLDCLRSVQQGPLSNGEAKTGLGSLLNKMIAQGNNESTSIGSWQTVTYGGTATAGDDLAIEIDGETYSHVVVDDTTVTTAMTEMKTALNADTTFAARWLASNVAGVLKITDIVRKGTSSNGYTFNIDSTSTGTWVKAGATTAHATGVDDIMLLVD